MPEYIIKVTDEFAEQMRARGVSDEYELVRCCDCKRYGLDGCAMHFENNGEEWTWNNPTDFCSWGERK